LTDKRILVINTGSSSVKSSLFELAAAPTIEALTPQWAEDIEKPTVREAISLLPKRDDLDVVGHRVVHGGEIYVDSVVIDDDVKAKIKELQTFAPLHNKLNLDGIEAAQERFPNAKHVAVFDTSFHRTIPDHAAAYPLPYEYFERDRIKRYGFHGINHEYCTQRAASLLQKDEAKLNLIICHLGNGCSITAVVAGKSVDNSMGFTPLEGLMMGTRAGSMDPGIVLRLIREGAMPADDVDALLNKKSGLLGVSGVSNDLREVIGAARYGNARAKLAIEMFVYRLKSFIGSMASHLPSIDGLIFTAGIGEHSAMVRSRASEALALQGCKIDDKRNEAAKGDQIISAADSTIPILVIKAREDWQIARECWRLTT
jgi:acetate kinase